MTSLAAIVAVDQDAGIGKSGMVPWNLPNDVAFFKNMTWTTDDPDKYNAVVMGRKTWESIPPRFRPLPGRLNIVLSRHPVARPEPSAGPAGPADSAGSGDSAGSAGSAGSGATGTREVWWATSLEQALERAYAVPDIERVFAVGGSRVYAEAMARPECRELYITRVSGRFDCDTRFPAIPERFAHVTDLAHGRQNGLDYRIEYWMATNAG